MILHFDTETTGIPISGVPSDDPRHPHIVSISAVLDDENGVTRAVYSTLIAPCGQYRLEDYPEAFKIHGITTNVAESYGCTLSHAIERFDCMVEKANILSAFNHHFDHKLLKIACARIPVGDQIRANLATKHSICTMESAAAHLIGKKRISLKNAYFEMFKEETQTGAHGSLEDTMSSRRIYYALKAAGAALEPKSLAEKEYATAYVAAQ